MILKGSLWHHTKSATHNYARVPSAFWLIIYCAPMVRRNSWWCWWCCWPTINKSDDMMMWCASLLGKQATRPAGGYGFVWATIITPYLIAGIMETKLYRRRRRGVSASIWWWQTTLIESADGMWCGRFGYTLVRFNLLINHSLDLLDMWISRHILSNNI